MERHETWYTADLHVGHSLVAGKRGFKTPETHDAELARRWDNTVAAADTIWVLGDISAGGRIGQAHALRWLAERPGTKHLITGNHDRVHPMHPDAHKHLPAYLEIFATVQQSAHRTIAGQPILLSHFPYMDSTDPDDVHARFDQWRLPNMGAWLLHGHLHNARKTSSSRSIHIGLDAWNLSPVSINSIARIIAP
jgi:calcineurin-like phosphoesterase family protein